MHGRTLRLIGAALLIVAALAWLLLPEAEVEMIQEEQSGALAPGTAPAGGGLAALERAG